MSVPPRQGRDGFEPLILRHTRSLIGAGLFIVGRAQYSGLGGVSFFDADLTCMAVKAADLLAWLFFGYSCLVRYLLEQSTKPPANDPHSFCKAGRSNKPALVFLGDSITHQALSGAFVEMVQKKNPQLAVMNCGQNSILTWTVAEERVKWVAACQPAYVSIMIGTNDVKGVYKKDWADGSKATWKLPEEVSYSNFEKNLRSIVDKLLETTDALVGLNTLCPMGEEMDSQANNCIRKGNEIVHKLVESYDMGKRKGRVVLVEVFTPLEKFILGNSTEAQRKKSLKVDDFSSVSSELSLRTKLLGHSYDYVSKKFGLVAMCDALHLNDSGARVVATAMQRWLEEVGAAK